MQNNEAEAIGKRVVELNVARDWDALRAMFSEQMLTALPSEKLESGWQEVTRSLGDPDEIGAPVVQQRGEHLVVDVPLTFAPTGLRQTYKMRTTLDEAGRIAGLFVLAADVP